MYSKRIKIFIIASLLILSVWIGRLIQMQIIMASDVQKEIAGLKKQLGQTQQLKTLRGSIIDRRGRILAFDEPKFRLCIDYTLSCYRDERITECMRLLAANKSDPQNAIKEINEEINNKVEDIKAIINQCELFGFEPNQIEEKLNQINNKIWNLREYLAGQWSYPNQNFQEAQPDEIQRNLLTYKVDIPENYQSYALFDLETDDAIFAAQTEFLNVEHIEIQPRVQRSYPYGTVAAQTIGWIGPVQKTKDDVNLFADDKLQEYLDGELCGREDGIEYVFERTLRGSRGEQNFDIDKNLISQTKTKFGQDVVLTLDIKLQKRIEEFLANYNHEPGCGPGMSVVIIDVDSADILTLVSMPVFDPQLARYDYGKLVRDVNRPLINRAINELYPPGSVAKPLILIAGMETGMITADEEISCPAESAPAGWPDCWIFKQSRVGHDNMWTNNARNALKGSCNVYFSRLADKIDDKLLQRWLLEFGYGQTVLSSPETIQDRLDSDSSFADTQTSRNLRQAAGAISSKNPSKEDSALMRIPLLQEGEKRYFGIGQGNLRVTPLQVANSMAIIARHGVVLQPRLFKEAEKSGGLSLGISEQTLKTVYEGMSAVVNETSGTAHDAFSGMLKTFKQEDVEIFGKTGSTEGPEHAWFAGFAQDGSNRKIAIAVLIENGKHGSQNAAPLACSFIQFCIEEGYLGKIE
jgi:penicillin-binding protein 2